MPTIMSSAEVTYFKFRPAELMKKRSGYRDQRALAMEMMYRYSRINQKEIARYVGEIMYTTVSHEGQRIRDMMEQDPKLKGWSDSR